LGIGFAILQKLVYAFPGLAVAMVCYIFSRSAPGTRTSRVGHVTCQVAGFLVPIVATVAYFYLQKGLSNFVYYNFLFNIGLPGFSPFPNLHQLLYQNPYLGFFGLAGLFVSVGKILKGRLTWSVDLVLLLSAVSLLAGLFFTPVPYEQYYLLVLPLVSIFAADLFLRIVGMLIEFRQVFALRKWFSAAAPISLGALVYLALMRYGMVSEVSPVVIVAYWFGAFTVCIALTFVGARNLALTIFLILLTLPPLKRLQSALSENRLALQIEEINYVMGHSTAADTVMDGFTGTGLFRAHAYFYQILPWNIRSLLSDEEKRDLLQDLRRGKIAPKLILFDSNLKDVSPGITQFFKEHYEPAGVGVIWKRKPLASSDSTLGAIEVAPHFVRLGPITKIITRLYATS
jgi:hypothetical protein